MARRLNLDKFLSNLLLKNRTIFPTRSHERKFHELFLLSPGNFKQLWKNMGIIDFFFSFFASRKDSSNYRKIFEQRNFQATLLREVPRANIWFSPFCAINEKFSLRQIWKIWKIRSTHTFHHPHIWLPTSNRGFVRQQLCSAYYRGKYTIPVGDEPF